MTDANRSLDILGTKPIAEAALVVTKGSVNGAGAFLSRICLPAAEEFGYLLKDKISAWRANNAAKIANKADKILTDRVGKQVSHAHPLLIGRIIEHGSWQDDDAVQNMWAGLLASSCDQRGEDQHNIIYTRLLEQITSSQAHFLTHICETCTKRVGLHGLIVPNDYLLSIPEVLKIYGNTDVHVVDVELDHLREIGLIRAGFDFEEEIADIFPTPLGLNFYVRCQGYVGTAADYFDVRVTGIVDPDASV